MYKKLILAAFLMMLNVYSVAEEYRCGWLENPTPGNWWLNDKDSSWAISAQGGYSVSKRSMENLPSIRDEEFVRTDGYYGYSCSCLSVSTNNKTKRILKIHSKGKQMLLKRCLEDKNIANPQKENEVDHLAERPKFMGTDHSPVGLKAPTDGDATDYMIQIFSTSDLEKAKRIKSSLNQQMFPTSITQVGSKKIYRVRVGAYPGKAAATFYQAKLKRLMRDNQGVQTSIIVMGST